MERKTKYLIIGLCCVFGLILGTTTAWYTWTSSESTDVTFTIGGVTVNYDAGDNITGASLRPTSDKTNTDYAIQKYITVNINEANKTALFNLYLTANQFPEILSHESFKWEVYESNVVDEETLLNRGSFAGVEQGDKITILNDVEIDNGEKYLTIYIYIDGNMENPSSMSGQTYSLLLSADATDEGTNLYKDPSEANRPELMSGMVPVEYLTTSDGVETDGWYVADETSDWYSYSEQRWANAVLVSDETLRTASAGTPVSEDSIFAYYVWTPRYSYQLFNAEKFSVIYNPYSVSWSSNYVYEAFNKGINIHFENGTHTTGTTDCTILSTGVETCTNAVDGNYYTHPAFWWDLDDDGKRETTEELTGIWVGKFEVSGGGSTGLSLRVKPQEYSWGYNSVSNYFTIIQNMMNDGNEYGISNSEIDSHMIKNMEWGAVAYLSHSIYGRCDGSSCTFVGTNDDYDQVVEGEGTSVQTGGGDYINFVDQSTTGNITGIYDMSGGHREYVMGNMISHDGENMISGYSDSYNSGFRGMLSQPQTSEYPLQYNWTMKTNGVTYSAKRYYDVYSLSARWGWGHLGDATGEVYLWTEDIMYDVTWGDGYPEGYFVEPSYPWFLRGSYGYGVDEMTGGPSGPSVFAFTNGKGSASFSDNNSDFDGATRTILVAIS